MNNAGSTMVEVIVGFVILVMVLAECMVHLLGVSGAVSYTHLTLPTTSRV